MESYKNKERAENIVIYLTFVISNIGKISLENLDSREEKGPLDEKHIEIFDKLSNAVAKLLDEKLKDKEDEVIINSTIPTERVSTEEAYSNFKRIDDASDNILSKTFKDGYNFAMTFNTNSYYGMDCYKMDSFVAVKDQEIYGPIYISRVDSPDLRKCKEQQELSARQLIKKMINR